MVSSALPLPYWLIQPSWPECTGQPSGSGPTSEASPPPCALPKVWPPAMSATVSSLFMPIRLNVTLMSWRGGERVRPAHRALGLT
jgi:hypothetical protein